MNEESEDKWSSLLRPYTVFRDAVHQDIWLTQFECKIIDTEVFQRLRHIRQLGATYLVYPTAQHTRFEHSLGAVYVAQKIIDAVQRNFENRDIVLRDFTNKTEKNGNHIFSLNNRDIVLTRMVALLHDSAHMPFGHTLEKEGNILKYSQWADKRRVEYFFTKRKMDDVIISYLSNSVGKDDSVIFFEELKKILRAIEGIDPILDQMIEEEVPEDKAVGNLDHPYVGDIVGNTICADLVDYILRDSYFTGLNLSKELRLISNFVLMGNSKNEARITLLLVKKGRMKLDALSGAVEFVRQRYFLAERVYYHRVKAAASAMLIGAVYRFLKLTKGGLEGSYEDLMKLGDDALVYKLSLVNPDSYFGDEQNHAKAVSNLISKFQKRELYKPPYMVYSRKEGPEAEKIQDVIKEYVDPDKRYRFQSYLEDLLDLAPGSIVLYVTKKDPGKIARTKCLWTDGTIIPLEEIGKDLLRQELEIIQKKHEELWRLYLFMDGKYLEKFAKYVVGFCRSKLIDINDIEDEKFSKYKKLEESEIFWDYNVPEDHPITKHAQEKFLENVKQLSQADRASLKIGVDKKVMKREFDKVTGI